MKLLSAKISLNFLPHAAMIFGAVTSKLAKVYFSITDSVFLPNSVFEQQTDSFDLWNRSSLDKRGLGYLGHLGGLGKLGFILAFGISALQSFRMQGKLTNIRAGIGRESAAILSLGFGPKAKRDLEYLGIAYAMPMHPRLVLPKTYN